MNIKTAFMLSLLSSSVLFSADNVDALAEEKCSECHVIFTMSKAKFNAMKAPPFWALAKKIKVDFPNRLEGIEFVVDYTMNPSKEKMIFPEATLKHFGLMPSQKGKVSEVEAREIAIYMLDKPK